MQSLEIAVFEAVDPDGFAPKQADVHRTLSSRFDGYLASIGLRSVSEPNVYADVVLWESAESARAAASALPEMEELAWFQSEIASIRFFDHLSPARDARPALLAVGAAPVVEIVLVAPSEVDDFAAAHEALHAELAAADVVVEELRLEVNEAGVAGDVNGWTAPEAMEEMGPAIMSRPEFGPVFDPANEMVLFMPFTTTFSSSSTSVITS